MRIRGAQTYFLGCMSVINILASKQSGLEKEFEFQFSLTSFNFLFRSNTGRHCEWSNPHNSMPHFALIEVKPFKVSYVATYQKCRFPLLKPARCSTPIPRRRGVACISSFFLVFHAQQLQKATILQVLNENGNPHSS